MDLLDILIFNKLKNTKGGGGGITPTGTIQITQNGETDVTSYATADVQVPQPSGSINITQNGETDVTQYATANVNVAGGNQPATLLQYVESPGDNLANLINVKIIPAMNNLTGMRFEIDYQFLGTYGTQANEIGCGAFDNAKRFTVDYPTGDYFAFSVGTAITTTTAKDTVRHTFIIDTKRGYVQVDNNASANITATTLNPDETFKIFGRTYIGTAGFYGAAKFYGMKVYHVDYYNTQFLMQDIVPAKDSNNIVCLYDKVNNVYYKPYNEGSNLIAGPEA